MQAKGENSMFSVSVKQAAAMIVESEGSFPGAKFQVFIRGASIQLRVIDGECIGIVCSFREPGQAREFATIDTAVKCAQQIARIAGCESDHGWTGSADRLSVMPQVCVYIDV